ncbi:MAG: transposase [Acidobacteriia bacterium]|nr:transposase [Terriglobia bacterium]
MRSAGKGVSLPVLVALGVKDTGEKGLLALATGGAETAAAWQMMLEDVATRHLGCPLLITSDGNAGLKNARERIWPGVAHQRCTVHKLRNLFAKATEHAQEAVHEDYCRIINAPNRAAAERVRDSCLTKWRKPCPSVAASLEEAGKELLTFYRFPANQHKSLRTTNAIERLQEEFRRRVRTQASVPSEKAALLLFFGLFASGQVRMRRLERWFDLAEAAAVAA